MLLQQGPGYSLSQKGILIVFLNNYKLYFAMVAAIKAEHKTQHTQVERRIKKRTMNIQRKA